MKLAKAMAWIGFIGMTGAILYGLLYGDFFYEGSIILGLLWGKITLVDSYVSFAVFIGWIYYRESGLVAKGTWTVLILTLGSYAICLYLLITLYRCGNDPQIFFMGKRSRT